MKKITTLFMLMIGLSSISTQTTDLYALVYPTTNGRQLTDLYNSDATVQDAIDKFLNNQPSLLDPFNGGTASSPGLGTRKLYLFKIIIDQYGTKYMSPTDAYAYIYYDTTAGYAKIHYNGTTETGYPTGELQYKKVLVGSDTATDQGWIEMPTICYNSAYYSDLSFSAHIKIKTSDENADQGGDCCYGDASLQLGSITISGYKMLTLNDYFLPVYHQS
jgi:hypothetical protein